MHPRRPQGHCAPPCLTTMCPISPAPPRPSHGLPSRISPPPTPVPQKTPSERLVGTAGSELELGLGRHLNVVADLDRGAELLCEPGPELERARPSRAGSLPGKRSRCARSTSPGEPTPTAARALGLEVRRLRRLPHRLRHLLGDVLGATAGGRRPACLPEHLPPAVDDDGLDLGAAEVDAAPGDHALMLFGRAGPGSAESGRWWSCHGRARARRRPAARGRCAWRGPCRAPLPTGRRSRCSRSRPG